MARLLGRGLLLAVPVLLVVVATLSSHALGGIRFISAHRYQAYRALALRDTLHVLAVGDSHAALGFLPDAPSVYSLAFPGERLAETALKVRFARAALPNLRTVLLQAQPHMFTARRLGDARAEYLELFSPRPARVPAWWELMLHPCCRSELIPSAFQDLIDAPFGRLVPDMHPNGFARYPEAWRVRTSMTVAASEELGGPLVLRADMESSYRELVRSIRADGTTVVLMRYPLTQEYRSLAGPAALAGADAILRALEQTNGATSCGAWDAIQDVSLFLNSDHLVPRGAELYWRTTIAPCLAAAGVLTGAGDLE